jgi:poly(A) polymerase
MALSRERIADELTKLLSLPDPSNTIAMMLEACILVPVLPEIRLEQVEKLRALIRTELEAGAKPDALRRLAALLPPDSEVAQDVAARLRLSNKARKRLACAAVKWTGEEAQPLAYRVGLECATDRLLLAGQAGEARSIVSWHVPRLPIGGGALIDRGLPQGPIVARTLRQIEDRWVEAGFPTGREFEGIVESAVRSARFNPTS